MSGIEKCFDRLIEESLEAETVKVTEGPSLCMSGSGLIPECAALDSGHQCACSCYSLNSAKTHCAFRRFDQFCTWSRSHGKIFNA